MYIRLTSIFRKPRRVQNSYCLENLIYNSIYKYQLFINILGRHLVQYMQRGEEPMVNEKFVNPEVLRFSLAPSVPMEQPVAPTIRKDFPESWIWENILDSELVFEKKSSFVSACNLTCVSSFCFSVFIITKKVHLVYTIL
jgi:hypothetical protein